MAEGVDDSGEFGLPEWLLPKPGDGSAPPTNASPTIGARMGVAGGMAAPAPTTPANPAPSMPPVAFDPSKLPDALRPRPMGMDVVPQAPVGVNNDARMAWTKKLEQDQTPNDPSAKQYRMGTGARVLGTVGNFLQGFGDKPFTPTYTGPGATNSRFAKDESLRTQNIAKDTSQLGEQEKLDATRQKTNEDLMKQVYEGQTAAARQETAAAQTSKADTASQLADIKALATNNQLKEAQDKLELQAKHNDQMHAMGMENLELRQQQMELFNQVKQQQLENDRAKFSTATDAKSLEAERKQRLTAIEDDWKQHPYMNKLFSDKNKEIQSVNDDINSRLSGAGVNSGKPLPQSKAVAGPNAPPTPTSHVFSRSGFLKANPKGDVAAAEKAARAAKYSVIP